MRSIGKQPWTVLALASAALAITPSAFAASGGNTGVGFNSRGISGAPTGAVFVTGGGAYNLETSFVHSAGGFRCIEAVGQGPLSGCQTGQGVRWDTAELLVETKFTCTGEAAKTAVTDGNTVVLLSDFYRAGDGNDESFKAPMIVSTDDIAPDVEGVQNVWIQGVGCGSAVVHFSSTH
jgi:hypothetical protein